MLSTYSWYRAENPTRNHFGLTGVWSRVRSHMGSAYFSLPRAWAQPNMHKAQCRGHPCVHRVLLEECTEASYGWWCHREKRQYGWMGESRGSTAASGSRHGWGAPVGSPGSKSWCWQTTSSATSQKHYQKLNLVKEANS